MEWPQDRGAESHILKSSTEIPKIKVYSLIFYLQEKSFKDLPTPGCCYYKAEIKN